MLKDLTNRLYENKIFIDFTDNVKEHIIDSSFTYEFGARPIKRYISKNIETLIANAIIKEEIKINNKVTLDFKDNQFVFDVK